MNLEGITLRLLTQELQSQLENGKIHKVFMPSPRSLLLLVRKGNNILPLLADLAGATPLVYIPDKLPERPATPPAFCMLLRKHLEGGSITELSQNGLERIITLTISVIGSGKQIVNKQLILELTGKNSNIIFAEEGLIIDALKHVNKLQSSFRQIQPNLPYVAPPAQTGLSFLDTPPSELLAALAAAPELPLAQALLQLTTGIGKSTLQELLQRSGLTADSDSLISSKRTSLLEALTDLQQECLAALSHAPGTQVYSYINRSNTMKDVSLYQPQRSYNGTVRPFATLQEALNCAAELTPIQLPEQTLISKFIQAQLQKTTKKLELLQEDLQSTTKAEEQRIKADTLMANIYRLHKGEATCQLENIYDGTPLTITLSPLLTPTENAQSYYKKYNKLKRAVSEIEDQLTETQALLRYLQSLELSLSTAETRNEVEEIKQELYDAKLLKEMRKRNAPRASASTPRSLQLSEETLLYVGKNNRQNDLVTFKLGKPQDLWFHTKDIPGSHVILKTTLPAAREEDILKAAALAAFYSKAQTSSKVPVDCVERRYVKKPSGAKPGFVIYTNQRTLYVEPQNLT